jgi:hypothetical protein
VTKYAVVNRIGYREHRVDQTRRGKAGRLHNGVVDTLASVGAPRAGRASFTIYGREQCARLNKEVVGLDQSKAGSRIGASDYGLATPAVFANVRSVPDAGDAAYVRSAVWSCCSKSRLPAVTFAHEQQ